MNIQNRNILPFFLIRFGVLCTCLLMVWSCRRASPSYPLDHPNTLLTLVQGWVAEFQRQGNEQEARARLRQNLKSTLIGSDRLVELLHPRVAHPLNVYYQRTIAPQVMQEAPYTIQDVIGRGMTHVTVQRIGPNVGKHLSPGDLILLENLPSRPALFTVRIHQVNDPLGLRLNAFFYDQGQWKSFFKLGELLEPWKMEQLNQLKAEHK